MCFSLSVIYDYCKLFPHIWLPNASHSSVVLTLLRVWSMGCCAKDRPYIEIGGRAATPFGDAPQHARLRHRGGAGDLERIVPPLPKGADALDLFAIRLHCSARNREPMG